MAARAQTSGGSLSAEDLLADYARSLRRHAKGRIAVRLRLSHLSRLYRQDHHLRAAEAPFRKLVESHEGQIFRLGSGDIVCIARAPRAAFDAAILKIFYLLRDDPVLAGAIAMGEEDALLCRWFDLARDFDTFLRDAEAPPPAPDPVAAVPEPAPIASLGGYVPIRPRRAAPVRHDFDAESAARLERHLAGADLGRFQLVEPVCLIVPDAAPRPAMRRLGIDTAGLVATVLPGVEIDAEPHLRARLDGLLARRLLACEPAVDPESLLAVFVDLGIDCIELPEFARLIGRLDPGRRKGIVIGLPIAEALARPIDFLRARERIAAEGLRSALIGCDPLHLALRDPLLLPGEFIALDWRRLAAWQSSGHAAFDRLCRTIAAADPARILLEHCADEAAIAAGRALGIRLFCGPALRAPG